MMNGVKLKRILNPILSLTYINQYLLIGTLRMHFYRLTFQLAILEISHLTIKSLNDQQQSFWKIKGLIRMLLTILERRE